MKNSPPGTNSSTFIKNYKFIILINILKRNNNNSNNSVKNNKFNNRHNYNIQKFAILCKPFIIGDIRTTNTFLNTQFIMYMINLMILDNLTFNHNLNRNVFISSSILGEFNCAECPFAYYTQYFVVG